MTIGKRLGFIGAGNMAAALINGLLDKGAAQPSELRASDRRQEHLDALGSRFGIGTGSNLDVAKNSDVIVLAVKPQVMDKVLRELAPVLTHDQLVISIAAGVPLEAIEKRLRPPARVVRAMPNTPALVGAGATALSPGAHATAEDLDVARKLFDAVGMSVVLDEELLDAVTGLSGSGPAYVFLIIEALADAGVKVGLSRDHALKLAAQTLYGASKLLIETGDHPGVLKDRVTSPGGTSIAGLHTLEEGGLRTTLMNAVEAATRRSQQLGEDFLRRLG